MMKDSAVAIIPVRMSSQRLPGKPLAEIAGKPLVERVWLAARKSKKLSAVYIATESEEIANIAKGFGAEVVMTDDSITTGSQRVAQAAQELGLADELVVNLQGDMPFINPALVDNTVGFAHKHPEFGMVTTATAITEPDVFSSQSVVKVVVTDSGQALYFSRASIPHSRDGDRLSLREAGQGSEVLYGFKHFGLYVFQPLTLVHYRDGEMGALESVEKLEQLRLLERGVKIGVYIAPASLTDGSIEVDTPEDLAQANKQA